MIKRTYIILVLLSIFILSSICIGKGWHAKDEGQMVQHLKTTKIDLKIVFIRVKDPSRNPKFREIIKNGQRVLYIDLVYGRYIYHAKTGPNINNYVRIEFTDDIEYRDSQFNSYGWAWFPCASPKEYRRALKILISQNQKVKKGLKFGSYAPAFITYQILKPDVLSRFPLPVYKIYRNIKIDLSNDIYLKIHKILKPKLQTIGINRMFLTDAQKAGKDEYWEDNDGDGLLDRYQAICNTLAIRHTKYSCRGLRDINHDKILDRYQTIKFYKQNNLHNFMDIDGDGVCDNYIPAVFKKDLKEAVYPEIMIDMSKDFFIDRDAFVKEFTGRPLVKIDYPETGFEPVDRWIYFVDEDNDGICDVFQNTLLFREYYNNIVFIDQNNDTICDVFQTRDYYFKHNLTNFIDIDGDGLCDNYQK